MAGTVVGIATAGANPCGAAKGLALAVRGLSAVQGTGQLINAADAAKNGDPLGFALNVIGARMSFGKVGAACFAAGTPVPGEYGCRAVEEFHEGDVVLMRPEHDPTAPPVKGRVISTYQNVAPIWELRVGGRVLRTTGGHPFWVRGQGWTTVVDLRPGQELRTEDGWVRVAEVVDTGLSEPVYNLEVAEGHTFFAGDPVIWGFALWAHNGCGIHGNSLQSPKPTTLYQVTNRAAGDHVKFGISSNLAGRYPSSFLQQNAVTPLLEGTRARMAQLERSFTSQMPGYLNFEPWAESITRIIP